MMIHSCPRGLGNDRANLPALASEAAGVEGPSDRERRNDPLLDPKTIADAAADVDFVAAEFRYVLTPVPESSSFIFTASALGALAIYHARRSAKYRPTPQ
jgi:hypothetical protein